MKKRMEIHNNEIFKSIESHVCVYDLCQSKYADV